MTVIMIISAVACHRSCRLTEPISWMTPPRRLPVWLKFTRYEGHPHKCSRRDSTSGPDTSDSGGHQRYTDSNNSSTLQVTEKQISFSECQPGRSRYSPNTAVCRCGRRCCPDQNIALKAGSIAFDQRARLCLRR